MRTFAFCIHLKHWSGMLASDFIKYSYATRRHADIFNYSKQKSSVEEDFGILVIMYSMRVARTPVDLKDKWKNIMTKQSNH
ncbi:hypothetical protein SLA2020_069960 [Shorea laevis]